MSATELLSPVQPGNTTVNLAAAPNWMQGRTLYGGASALLAYTHAIRSFPDLPPLRAAQVGFVAPVGQEVSLQSTIMRQGRNVTQLRTEIFCEGHLALTTFWLFGTAREPNAVHPIQPLADWPGPPETAEPVVMGKGPSFLTNNFELRRGQEERGPGEPVVRRWLRLKEDEGLDAISRLVLMGDTLPPGSMRAMQRQGPISSINWSFNLLDTTPATRDGWWLAETASEWADAGYSSERLRMWNADGHQVMSGFQSVAVFG